MTDLLADSNFNLSEPSHAPLQREVQRKLGKCLLRLQHYEHALKGMLASHNLSGPTENLQRILDKKVAANSNKTLGTLVGEFIKDYIQPTRLESGEINQDDPSPEKKLNANWLNIPFSIAISPEHHAEISQQLKELVDLRNFLVHHLVERFDVSTESGCRDVDLYLHNGYETIDKHYLTLMTWAKTRGEVMSRTAAIVSSPGFWEAFETNSKP